jgi:archaea-specific RecJ-like exonuclease
MILTDSKVLNKLQPQIKEGVNRIKKAIEERQPIIVRHHNDADGYSAGIALERGIIPLLEQKHSRERDIANYYKRLPLMGPFYSYENATKDMHAATRFEKQFGMKIPLIIICDTGSAIESLYGIQKAKMYGASVMVIDHHPPAPETHKYLVAHINPHNVGSHDDYCAGMLGAEIAHELTKDIKQIPQQHLAFIAAVAAIADKVESNEAKEYAKIAKKNGFSQELIERVAPALDFEAQTLGPNNGSTMMHDLLGTDQKRQLKLLTLIEKQMKPALKQQLETCVAYAKAQNISFFTFVTIPVGEIRHRGGFPGRGKACSLTIEHYKKKEGKTIVMGVSNDSFNFRCSNEIKDFDVNKIIAMCQKKLSHAQVYGGGHRVAGTMNFLSAAHDEVLEVVMEFIKKIKK